MPASYWIPLPGVRPPIKQDHLHAAFSRWFDTSQQTVPASDGHNANVKPYTVSPLSGTAGGPFGVEVAVLMGATEDRLRLCAGSGNPIRLGRAHVRVGPPVLQFSADWPELAESGHCREWDIEFLTPTTFRSGNRSSAFPEPSAMLRAPLQCWNAFSGQPPIELSSRESALVWVSDFDIRSVRLSLNSLIVKGVLGTIRVRCDDASVAAKVARLMRLAPFCGIGSFRGRGCGIVRLRQTA